MKYDIDGVEILINHYICDVFTWIQVLVMNNFFFHEQYLVMLETLLLERK